MAQAAVECTLWPARGLAVPLQHERLQLCLMCMRWLQWPVTPRLPHEERKLCSVSRSSSALLLTFRTASVATVSCQASHLD